MRLALIVLTVIAACGDDGAARPDAAGADLAALRNPVTCSWDSQVTCAAECADAQPSVVHGTGCSASSPADGGGTFRWDGPRVYFVACE